MGKLKLKKAGKALRRAGKGVVGAAGGIAKVAEAIVAVAGVVEELRAARRRPASKRGDENHQRRPPKPAA